MDRIGEPIELTNDDDWDKDEINRKSLNEQPSQFGLIGIVFRHGDDEQPWLVQDNRKALKNEFPCQTKADVLDKIANILDDMHNPPGKLDRTTTMLRSRWRSLCKQACAISSIRSTSGPAKGSSRGRGKCSPSSRRGRLRPALADRVSLGVVEVGALNVE